MYAKGNGKNTLSRKAKWAVLATAYTEDGADALAEIQEKLELKDVNSSYAVPVIGIDSTNSDYGFAKENTHYWALNSNKRITRLTVTEFLEVVLDYDTEDIKFIVTLECRPEKLRSGVDGIVILASTALTDKILAFATTYSDEEASIFYTSYAEQDAPPENLYFDLTDFNNVISANSVGCHTADTDKYYRWLNFIEFGATSTKLLAVDEQQCFHNGGILACKNSRQAVIETNRLIEMYRKPAIGVKMSDLSDNGKYGDIHKVYASRDAHPEVTVQFDTFYRGLGKNTYDKISLLSPYTGEYYKQTIWPKHGVKDNAESGFDWIPGLRYQLFDEIFDKGTDPFVDAHSVFSLNDGTRVTEFDKHFAPTDTIVIVGHAYDVCSGKTALDATRLVPQGRVVFVRNANAYISEQGCTEMDTELMLAGVIVVDSYEDYIKNYLEGV